MIPASEAHADSASIQSSFSLARNYRLYTGISQEQSDGAHEGLRRGYNGDFQGALQSYAAMEKIEAAENRPPLSQLLTVATGVLLLERSDYSDEEEAKRIRGVIEAASDQGRYLCRKALEKDRDHGTYLMIQGGIQGFLATQKIHSQPTRALQDGFQALKLLERSMKADPRIKDAYLGEGIFDCSASQAPLVVRGALKLLGRSANFHHGVRALRTSGYEGQYTSVASQLFLVQFLSPYDVESRREKELILQSLEAEFPRNPMYVFLRQDEALSFYPDSFFLRDPGEEKAVLKRLRPLGYAGKRYLQLVKMQWALRYPEDEPEIALDSNLDLREWNFYATFLEGLRRKREYTEGLPRRDPASDPGDVLAAYRENCLAQIGESSMTPTARRYRSWRVRDALRWNKKAPAAYAEPGPAAADSAD